MIPDLQFGITIGTRACGKGSVIQTAIKRAPRYSRGESEVCTGAVRGRRRTGSNDRVGHGRDDPIVVRRRRIGVAERVGRMHLEIMTAICQQAIGLPARASGEETPVKAASESTARVGGGKGKCRACAVCHRVRPGRNCRVDLVSD